MLLRGKIKKGSIEDILPMVEELAESQKYIEACDLILSDLEENGFNISKAALKNYTIGFLLILGKIFSERDKETKQHFETMLYCSNKVIEISKSYSMGDLLISFAWYTKGASLGPLGNYAESLPCFDRALEISPQTALTMFLHDISLRKNKDTWEYFDTILHCCNKIIEVSISSRLDDQLIGTVWYLKGVASGSLGFLEKSLGCFDRALLICHNNSLACEAWKDKGKVLYTMGKYKEALECARNALKVIDEANLKEPLIEDALELEALCAEKL